MEQNGIALDLPYLAELSVELNRELTRLEKEIYELAGHSFNISSNQQLQKILFEELGLKTKGTTKTGFSTDASVLDAAERAGLDLPFSCRSGICATCRARITEGAAVMTHNIALEPWETAAGFVLCCQARPTTASLEISFDHK